MNAPQIAWTRERFGWLAQTARPLFEAEGFKGAAQFCAQSFYRQLMIVALRQTRDGDGTNDTGTKYAQRKAAPVAGVVCNREPVAFEEIGFLVLHLPPDGIGTTMKTSDHIAFAAHPLDIVGRGPRQRRVKEGLSKTPDVDHQAQLARKRQ